MIKLTRVKHEARKRDLKRKRLLLSIGTNNYHITNIEAAGLLKALRKLSKNNP